MATLQPWAAPVPSATRRKPSSMRRLTAASKLRASPRDGCRAGNGVAGAVALHFGDGEDRQFSRIDTARHNGLQCDDSRAGGEQRITALVRFRGMTAKAPQADFEIVLRGHERTGAGSRNRRPAIPACCAVHRPLRRGNAQATVIEHRLHPAAPFFGGLEDEADCAVETAFAGQRPGGAEQHGGVAVMAAGMHDPGIARGMVVFRLFGDTQGVHIRAKGDGTVAAAVAQGGDDAGLADTLFDVFDAELAQLFRNELGRAGLFKSEFGFWCRCLRRRSCPGEVMSRSSSSPTRHTFLTVQSEAENLQQLVFWRKG